MDICNVAIIVNSNYNFYETTIEPLIISSKKANIPSANIYVVVGECDHETDIIKKNDYNIIFCKYVNIDYNGIIYFTQTERGLTELNMYTHFFYIHDTACFLEHFWEKINTYSKICNSYIKLQQESSKNIGLINVNWFIENKKELFSYYINYDKNLVVKYKAGEFPNKDLIYSKFNNLPRWLNEDCLFIYTTNFGPTGNYFINNHKNTYKQKKYSDEERLATVYNEPGIIKFQKNWGQGGWNLQL